ncbi:unnamed protein product [Moneuplotes crassus]|uniref:Protein BCP1 n=1 Tax=Euplotes crassus TaxID=5936 RepID=A0AAD1XL26_EUPCR|nr:unnamed protein product [Moneuplotes crassus]
MEKTKKRDEKTKKKETEEIETPQEEEEEEIIGEGDHSDEDFEGEDDSDMSEEEIMFNKILKRQKVKEDSDEEEKEKETPDDKSEDNLQADFEIVAPCESFFHSIKMLIQKLCDEQKFDISGLADALIEQQSLGSLPVTTLDIDLDAKYKNLDDKDFEKMRIKHNNDRDVYGITTVINFCDREDKPFLEEIYGYVMYKAKKFLQKDQIKKFISILNSKKIGLFINERYLNLPVNLIPDLLKGIVEDINFTKQQDDVENPEAYDFDYFIGMAKISSDNLYYKPEEERFIEKSVISFKFSCKSDENQEQYKRVIYLLKYSKFRNIVENIDGLFKEKE